MQKDSDSNVAVVIVQAGITVATVMAAMIEKFYGVAQQRVW